MPKTVSLRSGFGAVRIRDPASRWRAAARWSLTVTPSPFDLTLHVRIHTHRLSSLVCFTAPMAVSRARSCCALASPSDSGHVDFFFTAPETDNRIYSVVLTSQYFYPFGDLLRMLLYSYPTRGPFGSVFSELRLSWVGFGIAAAENPRRQQLWGRDPYKNRVFFEAS